MYKKKRKGWVKSLRRKKGGEREEQIEGEGGGKGEVAKKSEQGGRNGEREGKGEVETFIVAASERWQQTVS